MSVTESNARELPSGRLPLTRGISFKLARVAVVLALILGLILSILQVARDYSDERGNLDATVEQILRVATAPARRAAFELNTELAGEVLAGLLEYPFVSQAAIVDNSMGVVASENRTLDEPEHFWANLELLEKEVQYSVELTGFATQSGAEARPFGRLDVTVNQVVALGPFFRRATFVVISGVVRSLLLAALLLIVFHYLIGRSLIQLVESVNRINPLAPTETTLPVQQFHSRDELGLVSRSFNLLLKTIEDHMQQVEVSEAALRKSEVRFKEFAEAGSDWFWEVDDNNRFTYLSDRFFTLTGQSAEEVVGQSPGIFQNDDIGQIGWRGLVERLQVKKPFRDYRCHLKDSDGVLRIFSISGKPQSDNLSGPVGYRGTALDITREVDAEAQLRHAQKMQAVGQLTGGVSHDFNNLLSVIMGNLELANSPGQSERDIREFIDRAIGGAERGAELTQRLLSFSRKQPLAPTAVDANALLRGMDDLFRRTLGEHIEIELITAAGLWQCEADPPQLENALLNLAINARDAMPNGGSLTIETGNVHFDDDYAARDPELQPGQYVLIAISDTGHGIPKDIVNQVFEPFFTTKSVGYGSGLGLSMVYGFAKQSGGHLNVYSEVGEGSTFKLYLPRLMSSSVHPVTRESGDDLPVMLPQRVLVVEDEPEVLELVVTILEGEGCKVSTAASAREALDEMDDEDQPDLLLTDAVLPGGMSGADLAREVKHRIPSIKVLYMSGYTANAIVHDGRLDIGAILLQKPFRKNDLLRKIKQALEAQYDDQPG